MVLSTPKEPDYFSVNFARGPDWYRARFRRLDAMLVDASVSDTMAKPVAASNALPDAVPRLIRRVSPDARFIYLVRDPAERCHSAYWHEVRAGRESRSLREAVEQSAYYSMASYYHRQITLFLRHFPLDRFRIIRFEEFAQQPLATARACLRFAGLDAAVSPSSRKSGTSRSCTTVLGRRCGGSWVKTD
ncbi:MAG TPA: sulfotransferase [Acetobacteraceae bacterium]